MSISLQMRFDGEKTGLNGTMASSVDTPGQGEVAQRRRRSSRFVGGLFQAALLAGLLIPELFINRLFLIAMLGCLAAVAAFTPSQLRLRSISPVGIVAIFLYGAMMGFVGSVDPNYSTKFLLASITLLIFYLCDHFAIDVDKIVLESGFLVALICVALALIVAIFGGTFIVAWLQEVLPAYGRISVGVRDFWGAPIAKLHVESFHFLIAPFCLSFDRVLRSRSSRNARIVFFVIAGAVMLTASRGLIGACVASAWVMLLVHTRGVMRNSIAVGGLVVGVGLFLALVTWTTVFSFDEPGNKVKIGHIRSFFDHLTTTNLVFGDGLASYYYSSGRQGFVSVTEITPLDLIRYFGLPLAILYGVLLIFPDWNRRLLHDGIKVRHVAFGSYLAMSLTNPVLFGATSVLIITWYWSSVFKSSDVGRVGGQY